jgi:hypothetical protein
VRLGEQAFERKCCDQVTPSFFGQHRGVDRKIASEFDGTTGVSLRACEPMDDDVSIR